MEVSAYEKINEFALHETWDWSKVEYIVYTITSIKWSFFIWYHKSVDKRKL